MSKIIISQENPIIKLASSLQEKKFRKENGLVIIEGHKIIEEALSSHQSFYKLFVSSEKEKEYEHFFDKVNCEVIVTTSEILKKLSLTNTPQGILAILNIKEKEENNLNTNFLVLDHIQDPGNLGAIIRSAVASGFTNIFMLDCVDIYNEKVIRSSMGNLFKINYHNVTILDLENILKSKKYELLLADMNGKNVLQIKVPPDKLVGIIIGNEGNGVSENLRKLATQTVSIPMKNDVESLNAAVSASIIMYQFFK